MTDQDRSVSPWGEPAAPVGASSRSAAVRAASPPVLAPIAPSARPGAATKPASEQSGVAKLRRRAKRVPMLVERTILVRIIPRTGIWVRVRAAVALTVIAITIGLCFAAVLSVVVWGVATAIHHAAGN